MKVRIISASLVWLILLAVAAGVYMAGSQGTAAPTGESAQDALPCPPGYRLEGEPPINGPRWYCINSSGTIRYPSVQPTADPTFVAAALAMDVESCQASILYGTKEMRLRLLARTGRLATPTPLGVLSQRQDELAFVEEEILRASLAEDARQRLLQRARSHCAPTRETVRAAADYWIAELEKEAPLPAGLRSAILPAVTAYVTAPAAEMAQAENEIVQTFYLWIAANRPQPSSLPSSRSSTSSLSSVNDMLRDQEVRRLRNRIRDLDLEFGRACREAGLTSNCR